ncbi:MAG: hypothetical protein GY746_07670 [Gammaproteobacteria bacterium]|nr:hypothetical protein [Gammaproteobacteria bacterium]
MWQAVTRIYIAVLESRGKKVIDLLFPGGFANTVLVSGRWMSHICTYAKGHQLCLAHLLRELNYLLELKKTT